MGETQQDSQNLETMLGTTPGSDARCDVHVVGIGASAGGLEALEAFFHSMPTDTGMAFVVVQHLSPDFKSHMEQLLARRTSMPIHRVEDGMQVEPNSIYLIPPKKEMIISDRKLLLTDKGPERSLAHPIDQFFRSLANDVGRYSVGIILSGTGSDGSRGIRDIHEAGGLVIAQSEESARFDGMPLNAQETGVVNLVLAPDAIPDALIRYVKQSLSPELLSEQDILLDEVQGLEEAFQLLRDDHGIDFSLYKSSTVGRRLQRRVALLQCNSLDEYLSRLKEDREERQALYKDLLIGVTRFFRDEEAFAVLEREIIPDILARAEENEPIRVWAAGCGTGEEAYSIAILFEEAFRRARRPRRFKMFATDAHRASLELAANGIYSEESVAGISEERKKAYFRKDRNGYQVVPELRQMVVFAPQNVISDAPFTQMDLVVCRNLLIYFQPLAQKKVLSLFHFSLKAGGILFLGPSETPGEISDEFQVINKRWKIYRKRRDIRLPADTRLPMPSSHAPLPASVASPPSMEGMIKSIYDRLLDQHMPPSFLVDESFCLIHTFGGAENYLHHRSGRPSMSILHLIDEGAKTALSGALQHANKERETVRYTGIRIQSSIGEEQVRLIVQPLEDPRSRTTHFLIKLEKLEEEQHTEPVDKEVNLDDMSRQHIQSLEGELRFTRENLQATIEELETANEELQAANEELVASNEELQSTNEELHSVNEELYTVNAEHQRKIDELTQLTDDMDNLLASTRVGVIFIDQDLCIRRFTPELARIFHLLPQDIGRRIDSFAHNLEFPQLLESVQQVLESKEPQEHAVTDTQGAPYLLRVLPYHTTTRVEGAVLTLVDVRLLKEAQADLARIKFMTDNAIDTHALLDSEGNFIYVNRAMCHSLGYAEEELMALSVHDVDQHLAPARYKELFHEAEHDPIPMLESSLRRKDGTVYPVEVSLTGVRLDGEPYLYTTTRDITERKETERRLATEHAIAQVLAEESTLETALPRLLDAFVEWLKVDCAELWEVDSSASELVLQIQRGPMCSRDWQEASQDLKLAKGEGLPGKTLDALSPVWIDDVPSETSFVRLQSARQAGLQTGFAFPLMNEKACVGVVALFSRQRLTSSTSLLQMLQAIGSELGQFIRRARTEEALRLCERAIESATDGIVITDAQAEDHPIIYANVGFQRITGYSAEEILGRNCRFLQGKGTDPKSIQKIREALQQKKECRVTLLNYKKDRTPFWNELQISPVYNDAGEVTHFVGVQHDMTQSKQIVERLQMAQKQADAANKAKSEFLANMSHEIRTPMTAILGFADVLRAQISDRKILETVHTIKRNGRYLLEIINDILDLSRIEAGKLDVDLTSCPLQEIIGDVQSLMSVRAKEKGIPLTFHMPDRLPEIIETDRIRLRQILVNLLSNAIKFTDDGQVDVRVTFQPENQTLLFAVTDTGIGMSEEEQQRLFRPFTQADHGVGQRYGGTGLGLSISKRLAEKLGGSIAVESEKGRGSTFTLTVPTGPLEGVALVQPVLVPASQAGMASTPTISLNASLLVADDHPDVGQVATYFLTQAGARVTLVENGVDALEKIEEADSRGEPFDAIVLDMQMPLLTGYEVATQLRSRGYEQPIIALTAAAMKGARDQCMEAGCDDYLPKPIEGYQLVELVAEHLNARAKGAGNLEEKEGRRALIVDDNEDAATATGMLLSLNGHQVEIATNGKEAVEKCRAFVPDVVLLDICLPDTDGCDLLEQIRQQEDLHQVVAIALSGNSEPEDIDRAKDAGFDHYLVKPADPTELDALIRAKVAVPTDP